MLDKHEIKYAADNFKSHAARLKGHSVTLIETAFVPYIGWEMDNAIWLVDVDGVSEVWTTSHGGLERNTVGEGVEYLAKVRAGLIDLVSRIDLMRYKITT